MGGERAGLVPCKMNERSSYPQQAEGEDFPKAAFELLAFRELSRRKPGRMRAKGAGGKEWIALREDS